MPYKNIEDKRASDRRYRQKRAQAAVVKNVTGNALAKLDLDALSFQDPRDFYVLLKAAVETACNDKSMSTMQLVRTVGFLISVGLKVCEIADVAKRLNDLETRINEGGSMGPILFNSS